MRFMMLYKPGRDDRSRPDPKVLEKLGRLAADGFAKGIMISQDGLQPSSEGAKVRINENGTFKVTDGPFTETKEVIAGYAIMNLGSKAEAIQAAKNFLEIMGTGETEVRAMLDGPATA
jgi:hypothetical protein